MVGVALMPRMRMIKPGFFTNDELAEIPPLGRILFAGLWCLADRAGRLEDRPKKIKAELLPYDEADADELLSCLASHQFIIRYRVNSVRYIQVTNFERHQSPNVKEPPTALPAPCQHSESTVQETPVTVTVTVTGTDTDTDTEPTDAAPAGADETDAPPRKVVRLASASDYSEAFNRFWSAYPRRVNKHGAWLEWQRRLKEGAVEDELIRAADNLARYCEREGTDEQFIPHASTFIGRQRRFEDFVSGLPASVRSPPARAGPNGRPTNYDRRRQDADAVFGPDAEDA